LRDFTFALPATEWAKRNKPRRGPGHEWIYPKLADVLEECGMHTIAKYIDIRRHMIAMYVTTRPILNECSRQVGGVGGQYHVTGGGGSRDRFGCHRCNCIGQVMVFFMFSYLWSTAAVTWRIVVVSISLSFTIM
jgi:hypothetical protein